MTTAGTSTAIGIFNGGDAVGIQRQVILPTAMLSHNGLLNQRAIDAVTQITIFFIQHKHDAGAVTRSPEIGVISNVSARFIVVTPCTFTWRGTAPAKNIDTTNCGGINRCARFAIDRDKQPLAISPGSDEHTQ